MYSFYCVLVALIASKFCEKYYGQDTPGASHLAMTNLSKLCAALSALNSPATVSRKHDCKKYIFVASVIPICI